MAVDAPSDTELQDQAAAEETATNGQAEALSPEEQAQVDAPAAEYTPGQIDVKSILEAGVHFGHRTSRWNPKMRPYIYGRRNQIHIIDLKETVRGLLRAEKYLSQVAANGSLILFVGTKRQAQGIVAKAAERCGMPYCTERWLGGTLTNFRTVRSRLKRLEELQGLIDSGELHSYSKKQQSRLMREYRKISRNLGGIAEMNRLPEVLLICDPKKEKNAVHEAKLLGLKVVALIDTDSDPDKVDLPIPGNDDSIRSIKLIFDRLAATINHARGGQAVPDKDAAPQDDEPKAIPSVR